MRAMGAWCRRSLLAIVAACLASTATPSQDPVWVFWCSGGWVNPFGWWYLCEYAGPGGGPEEENRPESGETEDPGDDDDCGKETGGFPESGEPVSLYDGRKFHRFTPLTVKTSGDDFELKLSWGSPLTAESDLTVFAGDSWHLSCLSAISYAAPLDNSVPAQISLFDGPKSISVWRRGSTLNAQTTWTTGGPTSKYFSLSAVLDHVQHPGAATFALTDRGSSIKQYYRPLILDETIEDDIITDPNFPEIDTAPLSLLGALAQEIDTYGNRRDYEYEDVPGGVDRVRVRRIFCINAEGHLEAVVEFDWVYMSVIDPEPCYDVAAHPLNGKLRRVRVLRPDGACDPTDFDECDTVETDRVEFVYFDDLYAPQIVQETPCLVEPANGNWLGTTGDLVQVGVYQRVDRRDGSAPDEGDPSSGSFAWHEDVPYPHRAQFHQFRYYASYDTGTRDFEECLDAPETLTGTQGVSNYLRLVILPEQLEHFAQERSAASGSRQTLFDTAVYVLGRDTSLGVSGPQAQSVGDLAAKVVTWGGRARPANTTPPSNIYFFVVNRQYLSAAGCGCGGGGAGTFLSRRLTYEWIDDYEQPTNDADWRYVCTAIIEDASKAAGSGSFTVERTRVYDIGAKGVSGTPYMINKAIIEGTATQGETYTQGDMAEGPRAWVTHYVYDENDRMLRRVMTPAALVSYKVGERTGGALDPQGDDEPPAYVPSESVGLVYGYAYTDAASATVPWSGNRQALTAVRAGAGASAGDFGLGAADSTFKKIEEVEYGSAATGSQRYHLPIRVTRYRTESGTGADDKEVVEFVYGHRSNAAAFDSLAYVERRVERELESENGPGTPTTVSSFELFTPTGLNIYSVDMTEAITEREFQPQTGEPVTIVENSGVVIDEEEYASVDSHSWGRNPGGLSSLKETTLIRRDRLGRVISVDAPGSTPVYTVREMRDIDSRPGLSYYTHVELPAIAAANGAGTSDDEYAGPAIVEWMNAAGKTIGREEHSMGDDGYAPTTPSSTGYLAGVSAYELDELLSKSRVTHDVSGNARWSETWHDVSGDDLNDQRLVERWFYDPLGRTVAAVAANGTYTLYGYDVLDRVTEELTGVADHTVEPSLTASAPSGGTLVREIFYDLDPSASPASSPRVGNGVVSHVVEHVASGVSRTTRRVHDFRDRTVAVLNPEAPHEVVRYDNLSRVTDRALVSDLCTVGDLTAALTTAFTETEVDTTDEGYTRGLLERTFFSQRGLPYRREVAVDPANLATGYLAWNLWRDGEGRVLAEKAPNQPKRVAVIDGLGRVDKAYVSDGFDDAGPGTSGNFADATGVSDDIVVEQSEFDYHASRQVSRALTILRAHDASATLYGSLSAGGVPAAATVKTWTGSQFDSAARVVKEIDFGTNNLAADLFASGSAPTVSSPDADALVTTTVYDERGLVKHIEDPEGQKTRMFYDDLPRRVATVENWVDATVSRDGTDPWKWTLNLGTQAGLDEDRATLSYHDVAANQSFLVAAHSAGDQSTPTSTSVATQVTTYTYAARTTATSLGATLTHLDSNDLLSEVAYPDSSGSSDVVVYRYNRQGELTALKDQNGTIHEYARDGLGRVTADVVSALGSGGGGVDINGAIRRIGVEYDGMGRRSAVRSYDAASAGDVRNAVGFVYNGLWQITEVVQNPLGDLGGADELSAEYTYDASTPATHNRSRLSALAYPGDPGGGGARTTLAFAYAGDLNGRIHRPSGFAWEFAGNGRSLRQDYVGLSLIARKDLEFESGGTTVPLVRLDRFANPDDAQRTSGEYHGLDRFGRVKAQLWVWPDSTTGEWVATSRPAIVDLRYSYDMASNVLDRLDRRAGGRVGLNAPDERYLYDGLDRLAQADRGKRNVSTGVWTSQGVGSGAGAGTPSQQWTLDPVGNWLRTLTDSTGDGAFTPGTDLTDVRTANAVNEIASQTVQSTGLDYTYDAAGNMTGREKLVGGTPSNWTYVYDAWNRLVTVKDGADDVRAHYAYNGLHQRAARIATSDATLGYVDEANVYYYDAAWRLLEERVDEGRFAPGTQPLEDDPFDGLTFAADRIIQRVWGLEYIDELLFVMEDDDEDMTDGTPSGRHAVVDRLYSVVGLLDEQAQLLERVRYSAYGVARQQWAFVGDVTGDGLVNVDDGNIIGPAIGSTLSDPGYVADADIDGDGDVDLTDVGFINGLAAPIPAGQVSNYGNTVGYAGYLFDPATGMSLARFRWYEPEIGRWVTRDPIEYLGGESMYEYVNSEVNAATDPYGLHKQDRWYDIPLKNHKPFRKFIEDSKSYGLPKQYQYTRDELIDKMIEYLQEEQKMSEGLRKRTRSFLTRSGRLGGLVLVAASLYGLTSDVAAAMQDGPCRDLMNELERAESRGFCDRDHLEDLATKCQNSMTDSMGEGGLGQAVLPTWNWFENLKDDIRQGCDNLERERNKHITSGTKDCED